MCGIAGILTTEADGVKLSDLELLAQGLAHRGPDGQGLWRSRLGDIGLAHRRLAIIDTSDAGHQPMHSADGRYAMVYNGEVFNFLELRRELEGLGARFRSDSDSEVILEAWRHWGEAMLTRFNGMWALVIHDSHSGEVFMARDRFGIKPLLLAQARNRLAFASEVRALRALSWVPDTWDEDVVRRVLIDPFGIEGGQRSLYTSIQRLPAGHLATWSHGRLSVRRWWNTAENLVQVPTDASQQQERFLELFRDAIRLRMRSDVTIGTCLSGGFDSSAIVCAMSDVAKSHESRAREAADWRHAFIASFPGASHDETPLALEAACFAGVSAHPFDLSASDDDETIDRVLRDLDDIYISLPAAPWQIYRHLRKHGTVVSLDGHGADELMGAYRQEGEGLQFAVRNALDGWAQRSAFGGRTLDFAKWMSLRQRGLCFLKGSFTAAPPPQPIPSERDDLPAHWGPLNRRLYRMFHATILPTILRNFDRLSMAHGIEVRMPFMDWRLVCYVMSLPDKAKSEQIGSKAVARHAMKGLMPESIRAGQRKVGFNSPMPEWMNSKLGAWALRLLSKPHAGFDQFVDSSGLRSAVHARCQSRTWDWESVGRLWPYIHLRWIMEQAP